MSLLSFKAEIVILEKKGRRRIEELARLQKGAGTYTQRREDS